MTVAEKMSLKLQRYIIFSTLQIDISKSQEIDWERKSIKGQLIDSTQIPCTKTMKINEQTKGTPAFSPYLRMKMSTITTTDCRSTLRK